MLVVALRRIPTPRTMATPQDLVDRVEVVVAIDRRRALGSLGLETVTRLPSGDSTGVTGRKTPFS